MMVSPLQSQNAEKEPGAQHAGQMSGWGAQANKRLCCSQARLKAAIQDAVDVCRKHSRCSQASGESKRN